MGKATAKLLLEKGIEAIVIGREGNNLQDTEKELSTYGSLKVKGLNLLNMDEVKAFAENLHNEFPNLKYLVNTAGYFSPKPFLEHTESDYDIYHNFNKTFFFITQAVAKVMKANGGGSIVNIGSM